jgi:tRNA-binding protein
MPGGVRTSSQCPCMCICNERARAAGPPWHRETSTYAQTSLADDCEGCTLHRAGTVTVHAVGPDRESYNCAMHLTHDPHAPVAQEIKFDQFLAVDIRVGTIVAAEPFPEARKPALKLRIDFGPGVGVKQSSAQITRHYETATLVGRQIAAVVNFPPRQIGKFMSEVLTLGFPDESGEVVLFSPDQVVPNGARLF